MSSPLRIALTHPYAWPEVRRGAERITVETARALAARGHLVTLLTAGERAGRTTEDGFVTVRFRRRHADAARHERWFGRRLLPVLATGRFDVVHSLMPRDAVSAIRTRRLRGHRTVYEDMGVPDEAWWRGDAAEGARRRVVRDVDVYACMSRYALQKLTQGFGRTGALIPGGVRLAEFRPAPAREERPTLLFSGVVDEPRKGVALLLEAAGRLAADVPDLRLWLSGPGDAGPLLAAAPPAARERTEVLPLGTPGDQAARDARAWATVLPSTDESFGMVLAESLAAGTPIVVADHAAPPEPSLPAPVPSAASATPPRWPRACPTPCASPPTLPPPPGAGPPSPTSTGTRAWHRCSRGCTDNVGARGSDRARPGREA